MSATIRIALPLYMVGQKTDCWKCGATMPVVAIIVESFNPSEEEEDEAIVLSDVVELPDIIREFIQGKVPTFKKVYSKTTRSTYFGNTCPKCGVLSGDFFLHSEPGGPFFPTEASEAERLYLKVIPLEHEVVVESSFGMGVGELILKHAKRI